MIQAHMFFDDQKKKSEINVHYRHLFHTIRYKMVVCVSRE
jgi:hypothetical protein